MKRLLMVISAVAIANIMSAGTIKEVSGSVDLLINDKWTPAKVGTEIKDNTKIMTGMSADLKVDTKGGTFEVKELSMVSFHETSTDKTSDQKISIDVGKVKVHFTKIQGIQSSFKVQTPKGTASVRGTEEEVGYFPSLGMQVFVLEGSIDVADQNGSSFIADQGQKANVTSGGDLQGQNDLNSDKTGQNDTKTDNDTQNNSINDNLNNIFNDHTGTGSTADPERL